MHFLCHDNKSWELIAVRRSHSKLVYFLSSLRAQTAKTLICRESGVSTDYRKSAKNCGKPHFLRKKCANNAQNAVFRTFWHSFWDRRTPHFFYRLMFLLPRPICRNVLEDFCCIKFGGFSRGFSWRIFLGTFSHKNEEKKSGEKIREKIRRLKNKNPRKIRSAESRP